MDPLSARPDAKGGLAEFAAAAKADPFADLTKRYYSLPPLTARVGKHVRANPAAFARP